MRLNTTGKIFGLLCLLALLIMPQNVSATKNDWYDPGYNFRSVRSAVLLDTSSLNSGSFGLSGAAIQSLRSTFDENSRKLKCAVMFESQMTGGGRNLYSGGGYSAPDLQSVAARADIAIKCQITKWNDRSYVIPARTVWEDRRKTRSIRDRDGNWIEEVYYVTVPVTYPPRRVDISEITATFEVYDTRTGRLVFSREDVRDREEFSAQSKMFGRMCNAFFEDLQKRIR